MDKKSIVSLVVDIGNTTTVIGLFKDKELVDKTTYPSTLDISSSFDQAESLYKDFVLKNPLTKELDGILISSVVPGLTHYIEICLRHFVGKDARILDISMVKDLKMDIDNPNEVGGDLLAALVATKELYSFPSVIVDLGTVSKFLALDKEGTFVGASFAPGLKSSFYAMSGTTALLPDIDKVKERIQSDVPQYFGKNTVSCMRSGIYWSCVSYVESISRNISKSLGGAKLILTGGYSKYIYEVLKKDDFIYDPDLVLKGLNLIYLKNR